MPPSSCARSLLAIGLASGALLLAPAVALSQPDQPTNGPDDRPFADVSGPGQAVAVPAPQCSRTVACQYAERNFLPNGYRFQSLQVCGANCTTQYWVSAMADGNQLLEIDPVRGGGVLAVGRSDVNGDHPPVRSVLPSYAATDPACCPSGFADTTYSWDPSANALLAEEPVVTPAAEFPGWDAVRQELNNAGWIVAWP